MFPQFIFLTSIPSLTVQSAYSHKVQQIRNSLKNHQQQFNVVVVASSKSSTEFAYNIFNNENAKGEVETISKMVFIEPLLADRANQKQQELNVNSLPKYSETQSNRYAQFFLNFKQLLTSPPQPLPHQLTLQQFSQRIISLKQHILSYKQFIMSSKPKILLIASKQVLNMLGATDYHQNGEPVNQLRMAEGELDMVSLVVDGIQSIRELEFESVLPFCK